MTFYIIESVLLMMFFLKIFWSSNIWIEIIIDVSSADQSKVYFRQTHWNDSLFKFMEYVKLQLSLNRNSIDNIRLNDSVLSTYRYSVSVFWSSELFRSNTSTVEIDFVIVCLSVQNDRIVHGSIIDVDKNIYVIVLEQRSAKLLERKNLSDSISFSPSIVTRLRLSFLLLYISWSSFSWYIIETSLLIFKWELLHPFLTRSWIDFRSIQDLSFT